MHSHLTWDHKMGFMAYGDSGHQAQIDVATDLGGTDSAPRPMELILHGLGGCSGADIVSIIQKMNMTLKSFNIEITAERASEHPKRFTAIHLTYQLAGPNLDPEKVGHAIQLSLTKYCSVAASLNAHITSEFVIL